MSKRVSDDFKHIRKILKNVFLEDIQSELKKSSYVNSGFIRQDEKELKETTSQIASSLKIDIKTWKSLIEPSCVSIDEMRGYGLFEKNLSSILSSKWSLAHMSPWPEPEFDMDIFDLTEGNFKSIEKIFTTEVLPDIKKEEMEKLIITIAIIQSARSKFNSTYPNFKNDYTIFRDKETERRQKIKKNDERFEAEMTQINKDLENNSDQDDNEKPALVSPELKHALDKLIDSLKPWPSRTYEHLPEPINGSSEVSRSMNRLLDIIGTSLSPTAETAQLIDKLSDKLQAKAKATTKSSGPKT